jgi:F-type H+-transporting ATPase subunit delta
MTVSAVSSRYVDALFAVASRRNELEAVRRDVERLAAEFGNTKVRQVLLDPRRTVEDRLALIERAMGAASPTVKRFVRLLYSKRREAVLVELGEAFRAKLLTEAGALEGLVESARALPAAEVTRLANSLAQRLGKRVHLENVVNPALVGGFRVRVGSQMLDQSVSGRLERLRNQMLKAPLSSAR